MVRPGPRRMGRPPGRRVRRRQRWRCVARRRRRPGGGLRCVHRPGGHGRSELRGAGRAGRPLRRAGPAGRRGGCPLRTGCAHGRARDRRPEQRRRHGRDRPGARCADAGNRGQGGRAAVRAGRLGLVLAPPAARRQAGRPERAAGCRHQPGHPGRYPGRGDPARPALPVPGRLRAAGRGLRSSPRHPSGRRRRNQRSKLRVVLLFSPSRGNSPVGLDRCTEPGRHHHRLES